jgi:hypothetical protein
MDFQFRSMPKPPASLIEQVSGWDPTNPFQTSEYVSANESLGEQTYFVGLYDGEQAVSGCIGFLSGSSLRRRLVIPSLPSISHPDIFWKGVLDLCRELKVWHLQIDSYASPAVSIPHLTGELSRRDRCEHVLDLDRGDILEHTNSQHRRNISRAVKLGLSVRRTREESACAQHLELVNASLERRAQRGEEVEANNEDARPRALLSSGSAELFQALNGDKVLSSILILRARQGGYYESAGTLPEGMKAGASPFLVSSVATILRQEGSRVFNLGGATPDNPGLVRFKTGFGTREVALEAAAFCPKTVLEAKVHTALKAGLAWIKQ